MLTFVIRQVDRPPSVGTSTSEKAAMYRIALKTGRTQSQRAGPPNANGSDSSGPLPVFPRIEVC